MTVPVSRSHRVTASILSAFLAFLAFLAGPGGGRWAFLLPATMAADPSDLVARIQERYDGVRSLRADFLQETSSRATALGTVAHGNVYYLKPRAMRWDRFVPKGKENGPRCVPGR